jgi:hypothetical protein
MNHADRLLDDEAIVAAVYEALGRRHPKSRTRGRLGAPTDVVLRLLILKHVRNWSYAVLEREVRLDPRHCEHLTARNGRHSAIDCRATVGVTHASWRFNPQTNQES